MFCKNCGAQLQPGQVFCTACGTQNQDDAPAQQPQQFAQQPYGYPQQPGGYAAPKKPTDQKTIFGWITFGISAFLLLSMFLPAVGVKGKYRDEIKAAIELAKAFGVKTSKLPKMSYSITSFLGADIDGKGFAVFNFIVALLVTLGSAFILFLMLMHLLGKKNPIPAIPMNDQKFAFWGLIVGIANTVENFFSPVSILGVSGMDEGYTMHFFGVFKIILSIAVIVISVLYKGAAQKNAPAQNGF